MPRGRSGGGEEAGAAGEAGGAAVLAQDVGVEAVGEVARTRCRCRGRRRRSDRRRRRGRTLGARWCGRSRGSARWPPSPAIDEAERAMATARRTSGRGGRRGSRWCRRRATRRPTAHPGCAAAPGSRGPGLAASATPPPPGHAEGPHVGSVEASSARRCVTSPTSWSMVRPGCRSIDSSSSWVGGSPRRLEVERCRPGWSAGTPSCSRSRPERVEHAGAQEVAVVHAAGRLDQLGQHPVGRGRVVLEAGARLPVEAPRREALEPLARGRPSVARGRAGPWGSRSGGSGAARR